MVGYGPDASNLYRIDIATGRQTALTTGGGQKRLPLWSPDGKWIAYFGGKPLGMTSVLVLPGTGGNSVNVTTRLERDIQMAYWSPDGSSIFVSYHDGATIPIARIRVSDGEVQRLTQANISCIPFTISRLATLVSAQQDGSSVTVLYAAQSERHNARVLLDLNPQIKQWDIGE